MVKPACWCLGSSSRGSATPSPWGNLILRNAAVAACPSWPSALQWLRDFGTAMARRDVVSYTATVKDGVKTCDLRTSQNLNHHKTGGFWRWCSYIAGFSWCLGDLGMAKKIGGCELVLVAYTEPFLCRQACSEQWLFACVLLEEFNTQHLQGTLGREQWPSGEHRILSGLGRRLAEDTCCIIPTDPDRCFMMVQSLAMQVDNMH